MVRSVVSACHRCCPLSAIRNKAVKTFGVMYGLALSGRFVRVKYLRFGGRGP